MFPTTPILTNFTGADENPLSEGGVWSAPIEPSEVACQRVSNACKQGSAFTSSAHRVSGSFTEVEVYMTLSAVFDTDNHYALVAARLIEPGTANRDYYAAFYYTTDNSVWLQRVINGVSTNLASAVVGALAAGNKIGLSVSGTGATVTLKGFFDNGSGLSEVVTFNDTDANRIVSAGTIGLRLSNSALWTTDDFGGGETIDSITSLVSVKRRGQ